MLRALQALQVLAVLALAILQLCENAALNQQQLQLSDLKSRKVLALRQRERLQLSIEGLNAPSRIDRAARVELGLRPTLAARTLDVARYGDPQVAHRP